MLEYHRINPEIINNMKIRIAIFIMFSLVSISCKNGSGKNTEPAATAETTPAIEDPKIEVTTLENIGYWTMPITNQLSNRVTLKFNKAKGKYYTLEKMSNANKVDSSGVIVKKIDGGYHIEYIGTMKDNYTVEKTGVVVWHCPGYDDVRCSSKIDMNNLGETFQLYKPDTKIRWTATSLFTTEQASSIYEWSKKYVKVCVVKPETVVFPDINDVAFYSRSDSRFKIEYKATGKNLYNESVTYPVNIVFETPEKPVLNTISVD